MATRMFSVLLLGLAASVQAFNNPASVPVWCGKAYMASNASFNPGGQLVAPKASSSPLLDLKIRPRMSLYTADEQTGSFIVDAGLSYIHGRPYSTTSSKRDDEQSAATSDTLIYTITVAGSNQPLVSKKSVPVNSTGNEVSFSLTGLKPQTSPYSIQLQATSQSSKKSYSATTNLYHLPSRTDGGSAVKVDSLNGGLMVQDFHTKSTAWTPLFPYSYYASWSGYFQNNATAVSTFKSLGYNIVHVVPDGSVPLGFNTTQFESFLEACDKAGLWVMYDMRWSYLNTSAVATQIKLWSKHPSLLLWYTADEPDGNTDPLNGTTIAYNLIKSIDPYRPVSLVLNCANFYFDQYTRGTDIILEDAYPVDINATYSIEWHTPCNSTYGDCGCDDCIGSFSDISTRLDTLATYQKWIGGAPKPLWGVPQAFGASEYWPRTPTTNEEILMDLLSINHGAKGLVAWTWPTEPDLASVTSQFAKVVTDSQVTGFLLGDQPRKVTAVPQTKTSASSTSAIDAAAWKSSDGKQALVSVTYIKNSAYGNQVVLALPAGMKVGSVASTLWGAGGWSVANGQLVKSSGLTGLESDLLVVNLA